MKKIVVVMVGCILAVVVGVSSYKAGSAPERIQPKVDASSFLRDNQGHYSQLQVKVVPSYETRNNRTQEMVVLADFGAWYKGGHLHIVDCKTGKDCTKPSGRTLTLLDKRSDKEALYYKNSLTNK